MENRLMSVWGGKTVQMRADILDKTKVEVLQKKACVVHNIIDTQTKKEVND